MANSWIKWNLLGSSNSLEWMQNVRFFGCCSIIIQCTKLIYGRVSVCTQEIVQEELQTELKKKFAQSHSRPSNKSAAKKTDSGFTFIMFLGYWMKWTCLGWGPRDYVHSLPMMMRLCCCCWWRERIYEIGLKLAESVWSSHSSAASPDLLLRSLSNIRGYTIQCTEEGVALTALKRWCGVSQQQQRAYMGMKTMPVVYIFNGNALASRRVPLWPQL